MKVDIIVTFREFHLRQLVSCLLVGGWLFNLSMVSAAESAATNAIPETAEAQYALAKRYAKGDGVPQDYEQAVRLMRQAAEEGCVFAQNDLGVYYAKGLGVKRDHQEAARWYLKAAEAGDPLAQYSMGLSCAEGRGVSTNVTASVRWYKKAAAQNQPDAILALGYIYLDGREGIPVDYEQAREWFKKAAALGKTEAHNALGFIYEQGGSGVERNISLAVKQYRAAAQTGDAQGQMNLGRMYRDGSGVKGDLIEAYMWFYLAFQNGNGVAHHYQLEMEGDNPAGIPMLTTGQIAEAVHRAGPFDSSKPSINHH